MDELYELYVAIMIVSRMKRTVDAQRPTRTLMRAANDGMRCLKQPDGLLPPDMHAVHSL